MGDGNPYNQEVDTRHSFMVGWKNNLAGATSMLVYTMFIKKGKTM